MKIEELSYKTLGSAIQLLDKVFPDLDEEVGSPREALINSVGYMDKMGCPRINSEVSPGYNYTVALEGDKVLGIIGIYEMKQGSYTKTTKLRDSSFDNGQNIWVGWFAVDESARGQRIGSVLFKAFVEKAAELAVQRGWDSPNICLISENIDHPRNDAEKGFYNSYGVVPSRFIGGENELVIRVGKLCDVAKIMENKGHKIEVSADASKVLKSGFQLQ
jgi:GNAT superfamily N-acetyltransferase